MKPTVDWRKMDRHIREELARSEDYLTAKTFGMLRFLSEKVLKRFFGELGIDVGAGPHTLEFWPRSGFGGTEPDAWIKSDHASIIMEAKFKSALGGNKCQLGREWEIAQDEANKRGWDGIWLLIVTRDAVLSKRHIAAARAEIVAGCKTARKGAVEAHTAFISWPQMARVCTQLQRKPEREIPRNEGAVLAEIEAALQQMGQGEFSGWDFGLRKMPELKGYRSLFLTRDSVLPQWHALPPMTNQEWKNLYQQGRGDE
jgi:hypothetical protein